MTSRDNANDILQTTVAASSNKICAMLCFFSMQQNPRRMLTLFMLHYCMSQYGKLYVYNITESQIYIERDFIMFLLQGQ